jgi:TRAP-type C4-dicarboxylate transport system permease small subunit
MSPDASYRDGQRAYFALSRGVGAIERVFAIVGGIVIFLLMWFGTLEVLARWILNSPIRGYVDLVELSVSLFAFLGLAYCQRVGGHIRMDLLLRQLRPRATWFLEAFGVGLGIFVIGTLILSTYQDFLRSWTLGGSTMDLRLPTWPSQLAVTIALTLLWARLVLQFWGYVGLALHPDRHPGELPVVGASVDE